MWDRQRGRCALCEQPLDTKVWVIDHDHKTGAFRGLLHAWCNHRVLSMIERAGFTRANNAIEYLWGNHYRWNPKPLKLLHPRDKYVVEFYNS
jgi:hypothetical protein